DAYLDTRVSLFAQGLWSDDELTALVQTIEKSKKAIKLLKEMEQIRDLPPDKKELLLSLTRSSFRQEWQREQLIRAKFEIESKLNDLPRGRIKIRLKGYPGVKLTIGTRTKRLMEEVSYALYYLKDNEIRLGTLR
ncbi:MAG: FapA family protein, partial [Negativicutes bacterium]|nr:FapA family protein [Negativicutes bacterium]